MSTTDKNMLLKTQKAHKIDMKKAKRWDLSEAMRFSSYEHKSLYESNSVYTSHKNDVAKITNNGRMLISHDHKRIYIYSSKEDRWIPYKASVRSYSGWVWCAKYKMYRSTVGSC